MTNDTLKTYGEDVFSEKAIRAHLSKAVASKLIATMREGKPLDPTIADDVAEGMKKWALKRGQLTLPIGFSLLRVERQKSTTPFLIR